MCLVPLSLDCVSSGLLAWLPGMTCRLTCTTPTLHSMTVDNCWKLLCSRLFRSSCRTHLCDSLLLTLHLYMLLLSLYDNIMLQSVLNAAARLVLSARRSEHTTPLLRELHWLKVPERIQYRLCVLTCDRLCVLSWLEEKWFTSYLAAWYCMLSAVVCMVLHHHTLLRHFTWPLKWMLAAAWDRPVRQHLSCRPLADQTLGDRAFPVAAARAWNNLPANIRSAHSFAVSSWRRFFFSHAMAYTDWLHRLD